MKNSFTAKKWVRSADGMLAGVCSGISRTLGIDIWLVRLGWLLSVLFFGTGILIYLVLALSLPREDRIEEAEQEKFLGVCYTLSLKTGLEVGVLLRSF